MIDPQIGLPLQRALDAQARASVRLDPDWPAPPNVRAFSTLRRGLSVGISHPPFDDFNLGAHCGDEPAAVAANRAALGWVGALPSSPCWLRQVHGTRVWRFDAPAVTEIEADAAVTSTPGVVLAVLTADCLPVLFCAEDGSEVGAAHAGWRGLCSGVLENTVAALRTPVSQLLAWLGPAAGPRAYEVGTEVRQAFVDVDHAAANAFIATRPGHWLCDLYALARQRLAAVGVDRVFGGERCTLSEPLAFFSHRREGRSGRMAAVISIADSDSPWRCTRRPR
ncbi:peptidoglycan editing factor PgeF [Aquimonas sp.]|jgi:YfiH family protein|uniref:peptidoglycan editing factor PgeF n=1 Tax=Aquimonas sp. TaxID=1872588 RepID=UPI0037C09CE9